MNVNNKYLVLFTPDELQFLQLYRQCSTADQSLIARALAGDTAAMRAPATGNSQAGNSACARCHDYVALLKAYKTSHVLLISAAITLGGIAGKRYSSVDPLHLCGINVGASRQRGVGWRQLSSDTWSRPIARWLRKKPLEYVSAPDILRGALAFEGEPCRRDLMRLGAVMTQLGWRKTRRRLGLSRAYVYIRPSNAPSGKGRT